MRLIDADALREATQHSAWINWKDVENEPTVGGWISVKDRLPNENEAVNIAWVNRNPVSYYRHIKNLPFVATGVYCRGSWYWWSSTVQDFLGEYGRCDIDLMDEAIEVTHWMPLPEPPKEVTVDE